MGQYLDDNGLRYLWTKIKNIFVAKESGKGLSSNDYTTTEKNKLAGIANNANNYSLPTASASTLGGIKVGSGLSISNGVLSASGGQSLRVIQEQTGSWVCEYDNDYEVTITIPSSAVLIYVEAGPGDPDYEATDASRRTKAMRWMMVGSSVSRHQFSYAYYTYTNKSRDASLTHNLNTNVLTISSYNRDGSNVFYVSKYVVLGL